MFGLSWLLLATIILGAITLLPFIMSWFGGNKFQVAGKTVLVTGASQGMGKCVAMQLAAKGANVILAARNVQKLEQAMEDVKAQAANPSMQRFHYISNDLTKAEGNQATVNDATKWNNGQAPDIVWCVAGDSYPQFWLETSIDALRWQMDMNYWAAAYMAHTILNSWLSPSSIASTPNPPERHLIFTCSTLAFYPCVGYNTYSPAKAAMRNLHEGLRHELQIYSGQPIKLHTVFPGNISSPGYDNENLLKPEITKQMDAEDPPQTPDEVARRAIQGLERGEEAIVTNFLGQAMRAQMWSSYPRNFWLWDTLLTILTCLAWPFIRWDMDGKVTKYGKKFGHPSGYVKRK